MKLREPYFKHFLTRLADFRWNGRFGFDKDYVNLLSIPPRGMGLRFLSIIKKYKIQWITFNDSIPLNIAKMWQMVNNVLRNTRSVENECFCRVVRSIVVITNPIPNLRDVGEFIENLSDTFLILSNIYLIDNLLLLFVIFF